MRKQDQGRKETAYRFTVRQLESLVRLSEAMARLYCDDRVRPQYVREVCRLLKSSNINIVKQDLEFDDAQEELNKLQIQRVVEMQDEHRPAGLVNDLFVSKQVCVIGLGI